MNGARSTFMRKGYWLTALAAIVLLAASSWDGAAQFDPTAPTTDRKGFKVDVPKTVRGRLPATITVSGRPKSLPTAPSMRRYGHRSLLQMRQRLTIR